MAEKVLRKYGVSDSVPFRLYNPDGVDFNTTAVFAAGDVVISIDGATPVNTTNLPTGTGVRRSLTLTIAELTGAKIEVLIIDQTGTKVWLDDALVIETYGNAASQHAFDLGVATLTLQERRDVMTLSPSPGVPESNSLDENTLNALIDIGNLGGQHVQLLDDTAQILTDIGNLNDIDSAAVEAAAAAALAAIHLHQLLAVNYDPAAKPGVATALFNELVEDNGSGVSRYNQIALEQAPSGTGGDATEANQNLIIADIAALNDIDSAAVQAATAAALAAIYLHQLLAVDYDPAAKPGVATALLNELVEDNGSGVSRYNQIALEQAPSGTGGDATEANQNLIIADIAALNDIDSAAVQAATAAALAAFGAALESKQDTIITNIGNLNDIDSAAVQAATAAALAAFGAALESKQDTIITNIGNLNDIDSATVLAACDAALTAFGAVASSTLYDSVAFSVIQEKLLGLIDGEVAKVDQGGGVERVTINNRSSSPIIVTDNDEDSRTRIL